MTSTDWELIRKEYVNGKDSIRELADRFKVSEPALEKRAERGKWSEARREMSEKVIAWADAKVATMRIDEIAQFNTDDLRMARALRAKAAAVLNLRDVEGKAVPLSPADLRALASTVDTAQKIGRLALGMTTENTGLSAPNGGPVEIDDGARETIRAKLLR